MFRSISSQLQISYGFLVVLALFGVGIFGYLHRKSEMLRQVDEALQNRSKQISALLVRYDLDELKIPDRVGNRDSSPSLPGQPISSGDDPAQSQTILYRIWKAEAGEMKPVFQSELAPHWSGPVPHPRDLLTNGIFRTEQNQRQLVSRAVRNYVVLIGTDFSNRQAALNQFLIRMIFAEIVFLALFILIGAWLTQRALRPIGKISNTARTIADGALDQRIPIDGGSSELSELSLVLNESFDRLEDSILRQRKFTSDASHELRTPITAILAEGQSKPESIEEFRDSLKRCAGTARSMGQLVDQLLELARIDSNDNELIREPTDLDLLVNRAVQMVLPLAEEKSIQIEHHLDVSQADVNPVRIQQVILNLLNNAISYTETGGKVVVRLIETETTIEITVEDNGIGIAQEKLPHIFERFFRADEARADHENEHYGLGLAISREIAVAHRGTLTVESELDKGSVFTLRLPREEF